MGQGATNPPLGRAKRARETDPPCLSTQTLKYWDLRTPNPVATVQLPERCYGVFPRPVSASPSCATHADTPLGRLDAALDVCYPLMVVGTAERHIQIFNLNQPTQAFKTLTSPLRWQTRTVRLRSPRIPGLALLWAHHAARARD